MVSESIFKRHNYTHEDLTFEQIDEVVATGNSAVIKMALYALTLEGVLHQLADHNPPTDWEYEKWARAYATWAINPDAQKPPLNEF